MVGGPGALSGAHSMAGRLVLSLMPDTCPHRPHVDQLEYISKIYTTKEDSFAVITEEYYFPNDRG